MPELNRRQTNCVTPLRLKQHIGKTVTYSTLLRYLIRYCQIEPGYGVAYHLGYPDYMDNHIAVANWLHEKLRQPGVSHEPIRGLKMALYEVIPERFIKA